MTLVIYQVSFPEDTEAYSAWQWLSTSGAPQTFPANYQSDPTFSMAPYAPRVNPPGSNQPSASTVPTSANQPSAAAGPTSVTSSAGMNIASLALIALLLVIN